MIAKKGSECTIRDFFLLLHRRSLIEEIQNLPAEEEFELEFAA